MRRTLLLLSVSLVAVAGLTPIINGGHASAAVVTQRSLKIGSAIVSTSTSYTFSFVPGTASAIQGLKFQACTTAIGTCTAPVGMTFVGAGGGTVSGSWTNLTNFATDATGANDCIASASIMCAKRTQAASETASGVRTVAFTAITNQNNTNCSGAGNCTFFVRMTTYSTNTYTVVSTVDTGTVASATIATLTVSATIQETLSFCVGNTTVDNATSAVPTCGTISGTSLSLGTLSSANTSVSPVTNAAAGGDANNGLAELTTNADNGAVVDYDAIQQSPGTNHLGTLRVSGANCNAGVVSTDQCINAIGTTQATITAGTEAYGMTVAGINCSNVPAAAYSCVFSTGAYNLIRDAQYDCQGTNTYAPDNGLVPGTTTCGYAWDETGTPDQIASSSTVVGGEALILKFAATPNLVTPTGSYAAKADFVATPTF